MQGIEALFEALNGWTWWIVAAVLFLLELLVPGVFFLWLGIAALAVGVSTLFVEWSWQWQIASFGVLSLVSVILSRLFLVRRPIESDRPLLNRRAEQLVGREFVLDEALVGGQGRLKVDDSFWRVEGPDLAAGTRVRVVGTDDGRLRIEAAQTAS